jgi:hypothetical protein
MALVSEAGLATTVEPAVAVGAVLPKLARLVMLAGLVSSLSSYCIGLGIEIAFAAADNPSLILVVAIGASCGLLISAPPPAISEDNALWPGFSLVAACWFLWLSSCFRRSSAIAAAPVSEIGENLGLKAPLNRGDLGDGEDPNPAFAIEVNDAGFCD